MDATEEAEIINSHPIKEGLVAFRRQFESSQVRLSFVELSRAIEDILSAESASDLVLDLIETLLTFPAARILCSPIDRKTRLRADLFSLGSKVGSRDFDIKSTIPLVELVVNNAPDVEIWHAVFNLILTTSPKRVTPPTAFEKAVFDTPLRSSSASQRGVEQTHDEVDQRILEELTGRVYYDVGGFYERYFEGKSWTNNTRDIYKESRAQYAEGRWSGWPEPSLQGRFFEWFMKFQDTILSGLGRRYYTSASKVLRGSEADRKLDIFLTPADAVLLHGEHDWSNVLVIGEHKQNPDEDGSTRTMVQLAGYAREVFGSQPERRFVPGFTICGSMMRLWVFDRSGSYNSEKFDIHKEPERFIRVIAGYALMTDAELGLNTFVKHDGNGKYIVARDVKISLEDKPIASTEAIVCRGTTCYRGRKSDSTEWEYVVKFAWPSDKRQREGELLKLAKERGVTGIATWFNHEQIVIDGDPDTISHFRRDMKFGRPRKLSSKASWVDGSPESSRAYSKSSLRGRSESSSNRFKGLGIGASTSSSGKKRKRNERLDPGSRLKRSKSDGSYASGTNVRIKEREPDAIGAYSIQETVVDSLAHCRNEWQRNNVDCIQEAGVDSFTDYESEMYDNRVNYCLVTSPAGRPLREYHSVSELLEVLRDAIRGHRSLLEDGKILHRDISENNIIITELPAEGDPNGRLIDLDLAKELDSMPSGARHRTGTMQFMAIEVLEGNGHTYRHDLESFFYVFIWMCIRYSYEGMDRQKLMRPKTNILRGWYNGTYTEIANTKQGHMGKNRFEKIIAEFAPKFDNLKPLARDLRSVLFPIRDGDIFTGTFHDSNIMYDGMIMAFNTAIDRLEKEEQVNA
ncbi:serine threonine- kinase Sgk2 protein [Rutstroemia sp. NJR-2017a BBW]|nr:serine threonine- kinase Sgk2 protein [Rutstroemia sp. NJR-2017a BBW]